MKLASALVLFLALAADRLAAIALSLSLSLSLSASFPSHGGGAADCWDSTASGGVLPSAA